MAQQLRALTALLKEPSQCPSTVVWKLTTTFNSQLQGDLTPLRLWAPSLMCTVKI